MKVSNRNKGQPLSGYWNSKINRVKYNRKTVSKYIEIVKLSPICALSLLTIRLAKQTIGNFNNFWENLYKRVLKVTLFNYEIFWIIICAVRTIVQPVLASIIGLPIFKHYRYKCGKVRAFDSSTLTDVCMDIDKFYSSTQQLIKSIYQFSFMAKSNSGVLT